MDTGLEMKEGGLYPTCYRRELRRQAQDNRQEPEEGATKSVAPDNVQRPHDQVQYFQHQFSFSFALRFER